MERTSAFASFPVRGWNTTESVVCPPLGRAIFIRSSFSDARSNERMGRWACTYSVYCLNLYTPMSLLVSSFQSWHIGRLTNPPLRHFLLCPSSSRHPSPFFPYPQPFRGVSLPSSAPPQRPSVSVPAQQHVVPSSPST